MSKSSSGGSHISDRAREERRLGWKLAGPAFVIMVLVTFYPILQAVYSSLFKHRLTDPGAQKFVFLENYLIILRDPLWWQAFGTTALITVVTVVVELVLGFLIALAMAKIILGRGLLRTVVLIPYSIITVVSAFSWFYAFATDTGFVDPLLHSLSFGAFPEKFDWFGGFWTSMVPICVSEIWKTTPFMSLLLLAGLTVAARIGLSDPAMLDYATARYVSGDASKHEGLDQLPSSCAAAARCLLDQRADYEAQGVFPPGLIDAWAAQLFALEDENLREELAADRVLVEDLVARYFHIG